MNLTSEGPSHLVLGVDGNLLLSPGSHSSLIVRTGVVLHQQVEVTVLLGVSLVQVLHHSHISQRVFLGLQGLLLREQHDLVSLSSLRGILGSHLGELLCYSIVLLLISHQTSIVGNL